MEKEFKIQGIRGEVIGKVSVILSATYQMITIQDRINHDELQRRVPVHKISWRAGTNLPVHLTTTKEEEIPSLLEKAEKDLLLEMNRLANWKPQNDEVIKKLKAKGYL